ncbi:hypothetical protein C8F01DRAFT_1076872 [Mycena amicta]|nr:hypothetical protein C8F01DRAFT_1076872 [Mycena amicta]
MGNYASSQSQQMSRCNADGVSGGREGSGRVARVRALSSALWLCFSLESDRLAAVAPRLRSVAGAEWAGRMCWRLRGARELFRMKLTQMTVSRGEVDDVRTRTCRRVERWVLHKERTPAIVPSASRYFSHPFLSPGRSLGTVPPLPAGVARTSKHALDGCSERTHATHDETNARHDETNAETDHTHRRRAMASRVQGLAADRRREDNMTVVDICRSCSVTVFWTQICYSGNNVIITGFLNENC